MSTHRNAFILVDRADLIRCVRGLVSALERDPHTRAIIVCRGTDEQAWRGHLEGMTRVTRFMDLGGDDSIGGHAAGDLLVGAPFAVALAVNERTCHERVHSLMDPLGLGSGIGATGKAPKGAF